MHRAPFLAWLSLSVMCLPVTAGAQAGPHSTAANKSEAGAGLPYQVHISPTSEPEGASSIETGSDSWSAKGYDLRTLVAQIFDVDVRRVDLPESAVAAERFDIAVSLPVDVDDDTMRRLLADAIEKRFGVTIAPESRAMAVYVLTAPNGPGTAMKRHVTKISAAEIAGLGAMDPADDLGRVTVFGQDCTDKGSNTGIRVEASTMSDFRRTLEGDVDRVVIDETRLTGSFDFTVASYGNQDGLFRELHDQLGLVVTPAERDVTVLAVRPVTEKAQALQARLKADSKQQD